MSLQRWSCVVCEKPTETWVVAEKKRVPVCADCQQAIRRREVGIVLRITDAREEHHAPVVSGAKERSREH